MLTAADSSADDLALKIQDLRCFAQAIAEEAQQDLREVRQLKRDNTRTVEVPFFTMSQLVNR